MISDNSDATGGSGSGAVARIRPDDKLIPRSAVQEIFGGVSTSALYADDELMGLRVCAMEDDTTSKSVRVDRAGSSTGS